MEKLYFIYYWNVNYNQWQRSINVYKNRDQGFLDINDAYHARNEADRYIPDALSYRVCEQSTNMTIEPPPTPETY